jgi:hypothetical protein
MVLELSPKKPKSPLCGDEELPWTNDDIRDFTFKCPSGSSWSSRKREILKPVRGY